MDNKLGFKLLGTNVAIEVPIVDEKTKAGVIKSQEQIEIEKKNTDVLLNVLEVGDGVTKVKKGDKIFLTHIHFDVYSFIEELQFSIIDESHIVGVKL